MSTRRAPVAHYQRARTWARGTDPGLVRLRSATRTTAALALALIVLYLVTRAARQPLTVALLGVVIAMVSTRSANEPDPRRQKITMALLPLPAAGAITASALLATNRVAGDAVFVAIMFGAVYARRYGGRGTALGMVTFMTYFFTQFLHAQVAEVPWMIAAVVVGTLCSLVMSGYVLPDRPERVLAHTLRSLRARMAIVVDTAAAGLESGHVDDERRRRLRIRIARLNDTTLMVQSQLENQAGAPSGGFDGAELALRLFDAELGVERVAAAAARAAAAGADIPDAARAESAEALRGLADALRAPRPDELARTAALAERLISRPHAEVHRLALALTDAAAADSGIRALLAEPESAVTATTEIGGGAPAVAPTGEVAVPPAGPEAGPRRLRPTTRQAIQVAIAASLAVVAGELVSPARWYWAVIATFMTFTGTTSWAETLTKGWHRLLGTILGVPAGVLVATAVSGETAVSIVLIFVCLFFSSYLMKVSYSWMIFWLTTMLALLYGLLGQFSVDLLLLRIEETAIGAAIGVTVATLVLPTGTRTSIRNDIRDFLATLSESIETSVTTLFGARARTSPTEAARRLGRSLQQFRAAAKPMLNGITGLAGHRNVRRGLRMLSACDHYARTLAWCSERHGHDDCYSHMPDLCGIVSAAAAQTRRNIDGLAATLDDRQPGALLLAADLLDNADTMARRHGADCQRLLTASHALRQIDRAVVSTAIDLGAGDIKL